MQPPKRSPVKFFLIVFALALPFWAIGAVVDRFLPRSIPVNLPFGALMFVCPAFAALILVRREEGPAGVKRLLGRIFDYRRVQDKIWFLVALGLMAAVMFAIYAVIKALGAPVPGLQTPDWLLPVSFAAFFLGAIGEELGWMGYAVDPLQERQGAFGAALTIGLVWAAWHIIPYFQAHNPPAWVLWQCVFTVSTRIVMVWIYNNAGKSLFTAILYHTTINVTTMVLPNYGLGYDPFIVGAAITAIAAAVVFLWGPKTLAQYRYPRLDRQLAK